MGNAVDFVLPGDPNTLTGGYLYDRRIVEGLRLLGWSATVHSVDDSFPTPSAGAVKSARSVLNAIPTGRAVVVDGLALGGMAQLLEEQAGRLNLVGLVHHPLAMETGLDEDSAERLRVAERRALASVHRVIVTSPATAKILTAYGVGDGRIEVVSPGTTRVSRAKGGNKNLLNLLCVATLIPRKGHMTLLEALSQLTDRPWSLRCIGSPERSPSTARAVSAEVIRLGLEKRVSLQGEMDTTLLIQRYMEADVFVLASFMEGYAMVLSEALSFGLPIVSTTAGAIPDTVPSQAAVLVPPGDSKALQKALRDVMDDRDLRRRLAQASWRAGRKLPTWEQASRRFADALGHPFRV